MTIRTIQIKPNRLIPDRKRMVALAKEVMKTKVAEIRTKGLKRSTGIARYRPSTKKKRTRYGLQSAYVDLTGNKKYSRKGWRLLDSWRAVSVSSRKAVVKWTRSEAETLYGYLLKRYRKIF